MNTDWLMIFPIIAMIIGVYALYQYIIGCKEIINHLIKLEELKK